MVKAVEAAGGGVSRFRASLPNPLASHGVDRSKEIERHRRGFFLALVLTVPCMVIPMVSMHVPALNSLFMAPLLGIRLVDWFKCGLVTPVLFWVGWRFHVGAYRSLKNGTANMDVLVVLAGHAAYWYSVGSVLYGAWDPSFQSTQFYDTPAMLVTFILLGKYLEIVAKGGWFRVLDSGFGVCVLTFRFALGSGCGLSISAFLCSWCSFWTL
jgi:Cu+-exporting ATPase